jgi:hypothetical protein
MTYFGSVFSSLSFHDGIADIHAATFMDMLRGLFPLKQNQAHEIWA